MTPHGITHSAYYSFIDPQKDEMLSWPGWLTCSGQFTHNSGHPSAAGRAQDIIINIIIITIIFSFIM